jgi:hypothetical protein
MNIRYLLNGVKSMIETISMVDQIVGIEIDGKEVWVNENIGAIICLNLPSYMGLCLHPPILEMYFDINI